MSRQMIESGIEWIGEIPFGWKVIPQKYVMHKKKTICEQYNGEDIISLSMQGVHVRDLDAGGKMPTTFNGYQYVEPEDLLLCLFDIDVTPRCVGVVHDAGLMAAFMSENSIDFTIKTESSITGILFFLSCSFTYRTWSHHNNIQDGNTEDKNFLNR